MACLSRGQRGQTEGDRERQERDVQGWRMGGPGRPGTCKVLPLPYILPWCLKYLGRGSQVDYSNSEGRSRQRRGASAYMSNTKITSSSKSILEVNGLGTSYL